MELWDAELHNPVDMGNFYYGDIYKDRKGRFGDGQAIRTSRTVEVSDGILMTRNTRYKLIDDKEDK